jgi:uncharacterized YccA/Bax inhibitor family protein
MGLSMFTSFAPFIKELDDEHWNVCVVIIIAALNLFLDFDRIEKA